MTTRTEPERDDRPDFEAIFAAVPGPLLVLTPDLRMVAANADRYSATMTTPEATIGRPLFDLFPDNPDDPQAQGVRNLVASLDRVRATLQPDTMPVQKYDIQRPESEGGGFDERYWSPVNTPVVVDGELRYIIHGVVDVTEYVRMEQAGSEQAERATQLHGEKQQMAAEILARQREVAEASRQLKELNAELSALYAKSRELDRAKSEFFANVSHELRTPLALIIGRAQKLQAGGLAPGHDEDVRSIGANAQVLLHQVNQLLETARLESETATVEWRDLDLADLVRRTVGQFDSAAVDAGIKLQLDVPTGQVEIHGDQPRLAGTVANLVANAVKFTPPGGTVRCSLRAEDGEVVLEVADSGPGIPRDQREAVFERFRQGDRGPDPMFGGTGLGLSIVREVVTRHGGEVVAADAPEGGALLQVRLPRTAPQGATVLARDDTGTPVSHAGRALAAQQQIAATPVRAREPAAGPPDRPLVLLVEDNADLASFIVAEISDGFRVLHATDGRDALELVAEHPVELVLTDVMMPRLDGTALLAELKADTRFEHLPVIVLTARADPELKLRLLRQGAADFLSKPFAPAELRARVANVADAARLRRLLQARVRERTSQRDEANRRLARSISHDALTQLPNRVFLTDRLSELLARRSAKRFGVLLVDLDDLHRINEALGRPAGDAVLVQLARRLRTIVPPDGIVARATGDEFVVAVPVTADWDELVDLATRLLRDFAAPVPLEGRDVVVTASIGATLANRRSDPETLLHEADLAVRRAKSAGKNRFALFDETLQRTAEARLATEQDLRLALREDQLRLYYQPEFGLHTGDVLGFEALLRWQHPRRGIVLPGEVLPVARAAGLMADIDRFVLAAACRDCRRIEAELRSAGGRIWVNLSADMLRAPELPDIVAGALATAGTAPQLLGVEITETLAMDSGLRLDHFQRLVDSGVRVAIDDFGTGYSSLASLRYFPASMLKLDQSLVAGIGDSADAASIVRAAIEMGHTLGLQVLAEGVETEAQQQRLHELDCDLGQGFLLGKPAPLAGP